MLLRFRRTAFSVCVAAAFAGCSGSSTSLPQGASDVAPAAPASQGALVYTARTSFRAADGHRYVRDAVIVSKKLFPKLPARGMAGLSPSAGDLRPHPTAVEYLLAVAGIRGTFSGPGFGGWIQLGAFEIDGGPAAGALPSNGLSLGFTAPTDTTSPAFLAHVFNGNSFSGRLPPGLGSGSLAQLDVVDGRGVYLTFRMTDPVVSSWRWSGGSGANPNENVHLNFGPAELCAYARQPNGKYGGTPTCTTWQ